MQFQVPQFIDTEDRIVGPLTLKQFGFLAVAGIIVFSLYFLLNFAAWLILSIFVAGAGAALAFVKVNGRPMGTVVSAALHFFWKPQQYVWQQEKKAAPRAEKKAEPAENPLERIVAGFALKSALRTVTTGSKAPERAEPPHPAPGTERYQIFRGLTGEQRAARRIDYR